MQRNFILTDIMKTGYHQDLENFISMHSMANQTFDTVGQYYDLHLYDLDSYDRKFAILDYRIDMVTMDKNPEFRAELKRRCDLLHSQGFVFIKATPWESLENINSEEQYPKIELPHIKWTAGVSWFWFLMYWKHHGKSFAFDHTSKKWEYLYLNKLPREHRKRLYTAMSDLLEGSLYTNWQFNLKLPLEYELPWAQQYPPRGLDQEIFEKPYNDSKYSLVSETNDNNNDIFMTEKIWKPIMAQHVFVVHGNHLYLQKLREMGFKTFGHLIDESYDLESDPDKRIAKIVSACKELRNKNWQDIYLQTQDLRKHNHDTFYDKAKLSIQINKTLELFLEFADSGQVPS